MSHRVDVDDKTIAKFRIQVVVNNTLKIKVDFVLMTTKNRTAYCVLMFIPAPIL